MGEFSKHLLPILFNIHAEDTFNQRAIANCVQDLCLVAEKQTVSEFFKQVMKKILTLSNELSGSVKAEDFEDKVERRLTLLDLAIVMIPGLLPDSIAMFYKVIKPQLQDKHTKLQKKSYRALMEIIKHHPAEVTANIADVGKHLHESVAQCTLPAKKYRIKCYSLLVELLNFQMLQALIPQLLGEAIMCTKELNAETRDWSYELIRNLVLKIGFGTTKVKLEEAKIDSEGQGRLTVFFKMLLAGLGGQSTTMVSATVSVLKELLNEFSEHCEAAIPDILNSVFILLGSTTTEVVSAVIEFTRSVLHILEEQFFQNYLSGMCRALISHFSAPVKRSSHVKKKIHVIFEKLLRKFGLPEVQKHIPESYHKFIRNLNKLVLSKQRNEKKKKKKDKNQKNANKMVIEEEDEEVVDLADPSAMAKIGKQKRNNKESDDDDDEIATNKEGKLVIPNEEKEEDDDDEEEDAKTKQKKQKQQGKTKPVQAEGSRKRKMDQVVNEERAIDDYAKDSGDDDDKQQDEPAAKRARLQKDQQQQQKRGKRDNPLQNVQTGSAYKPRKAGGDLKREGKPDPYAYLPLDPRRLNKRNHNKTSSFRAFDKMTKVTRKSE